MYDRTMKPYIAIRIFGSEDARIKSTLEKMEMEERQVARNGLVVALLQMGIPGGDIRRILGVPQDVTDGGLVGGSDWMPTRDLSVYELFNELDRL